MCYNQLKLDEYEYDTTLPDGGRLSKLTDVPMSVHLDTNCYQAISFRYRGYRNLKVRRLDGMEYNLNPDLVVPTDHSLRDHMTELVFYFVDLGVEVTRNVQRHKSLSYTGQRLLAGPVYLLSHGIVIYYPEHEAKVNETIFGKYGFNSLQSGLNAPGATSFDMVSVVYHTNNINVRNYYVSLNCGTVASVQVRPCHADKPYLELSRKNEYGETVRTIITTEHTTSGEVITLDDDAVVIHGSDADAVRGLVQDKTSEMPKLKRENEQLKKQVDEVTKDNSLLKLEIANLKKDLDNAVRPDRRSLEQETIVAKKELLNGETALALSKQRAEASKRESESEIAKLKIEKEAISAETASVNATGAALKTAAVVIPSAVAAATLLGKALGSAVVSVGGPLGLLASGFGIASLAHTHVGDICASTFNILKSGLQHMGTRLLGWAQSASDTFKNVAHSAWESVQDTASSACEWVCDTATSAVEWVSDKASSVSDWVSDTVSSVSDTLFGWL